MKRVSSLVLRVSVILFALYSVGADSSGCWPGSTGSKKSEQDTQPKPNTTKPWCHNDPPIFCAAFCSGYDDVTFTDYCWDIGAHDLELIFEKKVMDLYKAKLAQGVHLCVQSDLSTFLTPCDVGVTPKEHPNQDHEVCEPVPADCPMSQ